MANITSILSGNSGSALNDENTTVQTFALSLASGAVLFGVQFSVFLVIRNYLWAKRIYQPRSFLIPLKNRVKPPANNPLRWLFTVWKTRAETEILHKAGMDAYFFIRYLTMCLKIFFPMACIILPILIPINAVDGKGSQTIAGTHYNVTGLDTLAWSNVSPEHTSKYWAHLILAVGVVAWVCFIFHHELLHYVKTRQEYLGSPSHRLKASSTTVLITGIPDALCTIEALTQLYDDFPGGVRRIWLNRSYESIVAKDADRKKYEKLLEDAETNLLRKVQKVHRKRPDHSSPRQEVKTILEDEPSSHGSESAGESVTPQACAQDLQHDLDTGAAWTKYMSPKERKTMRIPREDHPAMFKIPLFGRFFSAKVDRIYYCRRELARLNHEIEISIEASESCPTNGSAFIQFNTQKAAHLACQAVAAIQPKHMTNRMVEISPGDISWDALGMSWKVRYARMVVFLLLFILMLFIFGLISTFTGILSRVSTLSNSTSWLAWIGSLPSWLLSFIQGTLPPVIIILLLSGPLPILLRAMTNKARGATTGSQGERSLQLWYFIFLFVELFLVPTISAGLISTVANLIQNPTSVLNILATDLPAASNYYFSFLIVQTLSISASSILQTVRLLNYYVFGSTNSPDSVFEKLSFTWRTRIGSNIPWYTTFAAIGLVYSVIAPLILLFMLLTFSIFWIVIKNNLMYVVRTGNVDGGGLFFPSAVNQLFTGLYFMEICLIGLFFLVRDVRGKVACDAQGVIMAVVLVITILYQIWLSSEFNGLYKYAPVQLEQDAALREKDWEMKPLTTVPQIDRSDIEAASTPADNTDETMLDNSASSTRELNTDEEPHEVEKHADYTGSKPAPGRLPREDSALHRAEDMQAQQHRDRASAKHILGRLNRPLDEARLAALEHHLVEVEARVGNALLPRQADVERQMMNDPVSKIIMLHNDELEDLTAEERDMLVSVAFTHPVLRDTTPCVWIPSDDIGVSDDEVARTRALSKHMFIDNRGAFFDRRLKVQVDRPPPDMSEFALVMAEL